MGRITEALKKVTDERVERIQKKPEVQYVAKRVEGASIEEHIVAFHDPMSPVSEHYNILRTNIQQLKKTKYYKTFMITSSVDAEGKTVTSTNLAIAMAREMSGKSILLVDADLRRGRVAKYLGLPSEPGLAEVLQDKAELNDVTVNPGIDGLAVISSGKPPKHPSELLNSRKMQDMISLFKTKYDYVLIDAPPVMSLSDACILGPMTDAAILVVESGRTQRDTVKNSEKRLIQAGVKIAGFVMTKIENHLPAYLSRYMHHYDSYYAYCRYEDKNGKQEEEAI